MPSLVLFKSWSDTFKASYRDFLYIVNGSSSSLSAYCLILVFIFAPNPNVLKAILAFYRFYRLDWDWLADESLAVFGVARAVLGVYWPWILDNIDCLTRLLTEFEFYISFLLIPPSFNRDKTFYSLDLFLIPS
jgi:hypothetical protein